MIVHPQNQIDLFSIHYAENGTVYFSLFDTLDWKEEEKHVLILQEKINDCIVSVEQKCKIVTRKKFVIRIFAQYECNEFGTDFYELLKDVLHDMGHEFEFYLISDPRTC
ncbi:DUF6572 domain-containing protein [Bacillus gaemokensis]|uniref:DUF6572 domain-containing protein n=1 Tax=Bacillus gaemokensis TaxID=574375 RepID=UPI000AC1C4C1|nr:DUF6572 domain-containing protein [Bacillus gaemokensis]